MKVLFLHTNCQDYLADGLFHGLRSLLGKDCVDVPRYDIMYAPLAANLKGQLRGNGFTLYGLLPDIDLGAERYHWQQKIDTFDVVVIANIWKQWLDLWTYRDLFRNKKIVVLDGEDVPYLFPYNSYWSHFKKHPLFFFTPLENTYYFKRELFDGYVGRSLDRIFGEKPVFRLDLPKNVFPISFSIPKEKIYEGKSEKRQLFQTHVVDKEVAELLMESKYSSTGSDLTFFDEESSYYNDLRTSKFGITTKRAGWDCLRHYEIAAAGAVLCFLKLDTKPAHSAPSGLDATNCISYTSYGDLMGQIEALSEESYQKLREGTLQWARKHTTEETAKNLLQRIN